MAFTDNVRGKQNLGGIFVVRIAGLPYLFSHVDLPSQWDNGSGAVTFSGDDYEWSNSLILEESVGSTSSQLEPKAGTTKNGSMNLTFARAGTHRDPTQDVWLTLLTNNRTRSDGLITTVSADVEFSDTTINLTSNPWFGAGDQTLYLGRETVTKTGTETATSITVSRSEFGSIATYHRAVTQDPGVGGGQAVGLSIADFPLDLTGRLLEVYFCPGEWVEDTLRFFASSPLGSDENRIVFIGPVAEVAEGGTQFNRISVQANSFDSLFNAPACSYFPRATPYTNDIRNGQGTVTRTQITDHNKWFHCLLGFSDGFSGGTLQVLDYSNIADGDTLTIDGDIYTFRTTPATPASEIQISSTSNEDQAVEIFKTLQLATVSATDGYGVTENSLIGSFVVVKQVSDLANPKSWSGSFLTLADTIRLSGPGGDLAGNLLSGTSVGGIELLNLDLTTATNISLHDWVSTTDLASAITEVLQTALGEDTFTPTVSLYQARGDDGDLGKYVLGFSLFPSELIEDLGGVTFTYLPQVGARENKLKDLGFLERQTAGTDTNAATNRVKIEANKQAALFRWPAPPPTATTPTRIYFKDFPSETVRDDFTSTSRLFFDDQGNDIDPTIKIGDHEVVSGTGFSSYFASRYLSGITRGLYNSLPDEELYVEAKSDGKDKRVQALRVPGFRGCSAELILLFLLQGGRGTSNTYDKGWLGFGLGLPPVQIDTASFTQYLGQNVRDNWVILPGDEIREVIADECLLTQHFLVVEDGRLKLIDLLPVSELDAQDTTLTLDQSVLDSTRLGFDRKTNRIANTCEAKLNFNNASGEFGTEATSQQTDSVANYGAKRPVPLTVRGIAAVQGGADVLTVATQNIYGQHAEPTTIIEVDVCSFDLWPSSVGDPVLVTHPYLPSPTAAGLGVTELACRVHALQHFWVPGEGDPFTRVTLLTDAYRGRRSSIWAPSMLLLATSDGGTTWTVDDDAFGDGDPKDLEYFLSGQQVFVCQRDNLSETGAAAREIDTITISGTTDASTVTFTSPYTADTADVVVWFANYDNASLTERQQAHAYQSDGDGKLDASTDDPAYRYV